VTLPNIITLGRLVSVPVAVWLILIGHARAAFWLFVAAGISDGIDGYLAKRFRLDSEIGAVLDPLADKTLLMSVYVTLGISGGFPAWLVILIVARDVMILGGFLLLSALDEAPRVRPLFISKVNTALQILLAGLELARRGYGLEWGMAMDGLAYAVGVTTFTSGAIYLVRWAREAGRPPGAPS
jgi:cardiolipin synthase